MQLLLYTLVLPLLLALYALAFRKSVGPARRPFADALVIAATCGIMAWAIVPIEQKVKLGRDLRGGVSLVYSVSMPEGVDDETKGELLKETIKTLKNRVNPQGVLDLTMTPQGDDRIEVVMPLPGEEGSGGAGSQDKRQGYEQESERAKYFHFILLLYCMVRFISARERLLLIFVERKSQNMS